MYQLLLDSSNIFLSVGLAKDGKVFDKICYEAWQRQSEMMVTEIDNILSRNNIVKAELDGVVVGIGPGSYTGVRIGVTIAKTIAYSLGIKLYSKSSLSLLKHREIPTICVFNARSGRSYFAVYEGKKVIEKDSVLENEKVIEYIKEHPNYLVHGDTYQLGLESGKFDIIENLADFDKNDEVNPFKANPIYLKDLGKWLTIV